MSESEVIPPTRQRLHPTSLVFEFVSGIRRFLFPALIALLGAASGSRVGLIVAASLFLVQAIISTFSYLTLRYEITPSELIVQRGWIFRSVRRIPLPRIQNVDMVQNLLHRAMSVAEVKIETASGTEPEAVLRVLSLDQVENLRRGIFGQSVPTLNLEQVDAPKSDSSPPSIVTDGVDPLVYSIPAKHLLIAGLCSNQGLVLVSLAIGALYELNAIQGGKWRSSGIWQIFDWNPQRWLLLIVAAILGGMIIVRLLSAVWFVLRFYGYRMTKHGGDLRISCGLFTRISATVPVERIQFISIQNTWLLRKLGFATIRVETAGGGGKSNEEATQTVGRRWFVPVIRSDQVAEVLIRIRPDHQWDESTFPWQGLSPGAASRMMRIAIIVDVLFIGVGLLVWFPWGGLIAVALLPVLIWRAIRKARSHRYFRTDTMLGFRSGTFTRKFSMTFLNKIQVVRWSQSPFDRRWKMAQLTIDTAAAGPADHKINVEMLDAEIARRECQALALRLDEAV
jgi:putative membrane protein